MQAAAGFDVEAAREKRIVGLGERAQGFAREVLGDAAHLDATDPLAE